jgi:hypothetical protein
VLANFVRSYHGLLHPIIIWPTLLGLLVPQSMGNKKREKGRARKAKAAAAQLAATQQTPFNSGALARQSMIESKGWRGWAMVGLTHGCNHGCPVLPAPDHVVSLFMDARWDRSGVQESPGRFIFDIFDNHRQVLDDATLRKMSLDIMVAMGTNIILGTDDHGIKVAMNYLAVTIATMEQYNGTGKCGFNLAACKGLLVKDDTSFGGDQEIIRFFLKRISCTCLKAMY